MLKNYAIFFILIIFISSCKSTKSTTSSIEKLSARRILKKNEKADFNRQSIKANLAVKYIGKEELPNLNASMRMVKDSIIWLSFSKLGFPVAKLLITKNEVKFYEKISKTYFIGNFELISKTLGVDFDFNKAQNLFLGETLLDLKSENYNALIVENYYQLVSKKKNELLYAISFWFDPVHFKLVKEEIVHKKRNQRLTVLYNTFDNRNGLIFPNGFRINANNVRNKTTIDVQYKKVQFDILMRFPFKIPKGYSMIKIK